MSLVYPLYVVCLIESFHGFILGRHSVAHEQVQARMCVAEPGVYSGIYDCFRQTIKQEGATSLFKGYVPSFLRIIPYKGIAEWADCLFLFIFASAFAWKPVHAY